jgi:hypothetical protein
LYFRNGQPSLTGLHAQLLLDTQVATRELYRRVGIATLLRRVQGISRGGSQDVVGTTEARTKPKERVMVWSATKSSQRDADVFDGNNKNERPWHSQSSSLRVSSSPRRQGAFVVIEGYSPWGHITPPQSTIALFTGNIEKISYRLAVPFDWFYPDSTPHLQNKQRTTRRPNRQLLLGWHSEAGEHGCLDKGPERDKSLQQLV